MINWKSLLSSFNDKPTLLEWLKLVEKALKESVLTSVTTEQDADKANTKLIFNFDDGTQIDTGFFPTKGKDAAEIRSATSMYMGTTGGLSKSRVTFNKSDDRSFYTDIMAKAGKAVESFSSTVKEVTDENTVNTITVNYDDKTSNTFEVSSARGIGITGIDVVGDEVVGDETLTTLRVHYSNGTNDEFVVTAKNGKDGSGGKFYKHVLRVSDIAAGLEAPVLEIFFIDNNSQKTTDINLINALIKKSYNYRVKIPSSLIPNYYECDNATCDVSAKIIRIYYYNAYPFKANDTTNASIDLNNPNFSEEVIEL